MIRKLPRNVFSALLALAATVVFFLWVLDDGDSDAFGPTADEERVPAWYWNNAQFWNFNLDGSLHQDAVAIDVKHFSEEEVTLLREPRVITHGGDDISWHTRAEFGEVREQNDVIELSRDVEIRNDDNSFNIQTERLILIRSKNMAETDAAVTFTHEAGRTDAVGMRAWLRKEKVELLSEVKSTYKPESAPAKP